MIAVFVIITVLSSELIGGSKSLQLFFGDCSIYFEEPYPFKPQLPNDFNVLTPTKILIHGYGGLKMDYAIKNVSEAYQALGHNIILVDWEALALIPCYVSAYLNTWHVGQCLAILLVSLLPLGISPSFVHVIGFSLGAHIAGFAGAHLRKTIGIPLQRITGLDPALPFFATLKDDWKLNPSNAKFVDVIHTSAGSFGKIEAVGDVDFYVNGGSLQPACYNARYPPLCSHVMSGVYFAESITNNNRSFIGRYCENVASYMLDFCDTERKAVMGEFVSHTTRGTYFVETASKPPFALGRINLNNRRRGFLKYFIQKLQFNRKKM